MFSMQCSINAINVASLYVAVRRPVSSIATTRCPSTSGSSASLIKMHPRCQHQAVYLHHCIIATGRDIVGKLVRDKIPGIIRASGRTPFVTTLTTDEYRTALTEKLREEVGELLAAKDVNARHRRSRR